MLWLFAIGIALGKERFFLAAPMEDLGVFWISLLLFYSLMEGTHLAGVILWLGRKVRRKPGFPVQPGHWLLLIHGLGMACGFLGLLVLNPVVGEMGEALPMRIVMVVGYSIALASFRAKEMKSWIAAIVVLLIQYSVELFLLVLLLASDYLPRRNVQGRDFGIAMDIGGYFFAAQTLFRYVTWLLVSFDAGNDLRSRRRDILHWAGVVVFLAPTVVELALWLSRQMF